MITFGRQICGTLEAAASREWLVTDGLGGYAMGTVAGLRTRRYHGLLVVAEPGTAARQMGLVGLDAVVRIGDRRIRLATHEWASRAVDPAGYVHLAGFELDRGVPRWRWDLGDVQLEHEVTMPHGRSAVGVLWRLVRAPRLIVLELTPLCTWRDVHGERRAMGDPEVEPVSDGFIFAGAFRVSGPNWRPDGGWYQGAFAREEAARGLEPVEDLWAAGSFVAELEPGETAGVTAAAEPFDHPLSHPVTQVRQSRERAVQLARTAGARDTVSQQLAIAADQFVVASPTGWTVIAGYPWFGEWSRDLMTAFEGLFLTTNQHSNGRHVLLRAGATVSEGMLANTADTGSLEYNTADAALWFIHAIGRYVATTADLDLVAALGDTMDDIVDRHLHGTRFGIVADAADGLLRQGAEGLALTWMDARVDGQPVTARQGKPVEINALWINALATTAELFARIGRPCDWAALADRATVSFRRRFPRPGGRGLYDVVDGPDGDDASVRPNQLLAVSLPHGPVDDASVVQTCMSHLFTSVGLRSLAPGSGGYCGHHRGSSMERDRAYHQGTVWPWLIGPFVDAVRRVGGDEGGLLEGLELHLPEWGLGSVSETADGDPPHHATGCPFQAWSVAELLRVRTGVGLGGIPTLPARS